MHFILALPILTVFTLTLIRVTTYSPLKTLTVLLLATRCLALAPLIVLIVILADLGLKRNNISLENFFYSHFPLLIVFKVIKTIVFLVLTFVALALWTTDCLIPQALAIQLQTLSVLAPAT